MAQEIGKVDNVSKTEKNEFFAQKIVIFSKFQILAKSSFFKKILSHSKNQFHTLAEQVLTQQIPIILCCYYKSPHTRPFKRALVGFSGTRSCGDIDNINFLIHFLENCKIAQVV